MGLGGGLVGGEGSSSGGYLSFTLRYAAHTLFGIQLSPEDVAEGRNGVEWVYKQSTRGRAAAPSTDFAQVLLKSPQDPTKVLLRFAAAYGFKNIQNVVRKVKSLPMPPPTVPKLASGDIEMDDRIVSSSVRQRTATATKDMFDFVELMACPSGCINGGGQLKNPSLPSKDWIGLEEQSYKWTRDQFGIQVPGENAPAMEIYNQLTRDPQTRERVLYTTYEAIERKNLSSLGVKW